MVVESFEQARALSRGELQQLLASERPEQRLWAIWALALALGDAAGDFAHRISDEPDPGVRRHLAVVLAGHGEHDLLLELVTEDRSPVVRESTIALLVRIAAGTPASHPRAARMRAILEEAARGTDAILTALLGAIGKGAPDYQVAIARRALANAAHDVQAEAFETLLRIDSPDTASVARQWFRGRHDLASYVERWLRASDVLSLAEAIHDLPAQVRFEVLERLRVPPWPAVERLVGDDLWLLRSMLARVEVPATVLAKAVLRGAEAGFAERLTKKLATAAAGRSVLAELRGALESSDPEDSVRALAERVRELGDAIEVPDRDDLLAELADTHPVERLIALEHTVVRWLAERDAPTELLPMLAELEHYCVQRMMVLRASGADRRPRNRPAELGNAGVDPHAAYARFRDLEDLGAAIKRLGERS